MHAILATRPIECYSYSYCVGGSGICMLIVRYCICSISLDHDFHKEVEAEQNCYQSHYHLVILNIVQSGQPSVDTSC